MYLCMYVGMGRKYLQISGTSAIAMQIRGYLRGTDEGNERTIL